MRHHDLERIAAAVVLALLIHLVIGVVVALTAPWERFDEEPYQEPIRVLLQPQEEATAPEPQPEEPTQPEPEPQPEPPPVAPLRPG